MIPRDITGITMADIESLISNSVPEGLQIEYKSDLPGTSNDSKKEFLSDASSFANAEGGDLIYGLREEDGIPVEITDLSSDGVDVIKQRLENLLRDGLSPRISANIQPITSEAAAVLLVRVAKSWNKPHRVIFNGHDRFYSRNSAGKYPLDVEELRQVFAGGRAAISEMKRFVTERTFALFEDVSFVHMGAHAKMMLLLLPIEAFSTDCRYDLSFVDVRDLPPLSQYGWSHLYNLEGILTFSMAADDATYSYAEIYRNGAIEAASSSVFMGISSKDRVFYASSVEKEAIAILPAYFALYKKLGIRPPVGISISFVGIHDYPFRYGSSYGVREAPPLKKDILTLPIETVSDFDRKPSTILRPLFNLLWNAYGFKSCPNYDASEGWIER